MSDSEDLDRASRHLMSMFGSRAAQVADRRAENAHLPAGGAAEIWRRIAARVREFERGTAAPLPALPLPSTELPRSGRSRSRRRCRTRLPGSHQRRRVQATGPAA